MANGWGGARANAGRKKKADRFASEIAQAERRVADRLPQLIDNLMLLADGGWEQVTETLEPAGLIQITKEVITSDGTVSVRELAFPELPPEQLVVVRRTRATAAPNLRANEYLVDRILGRPVAAVEAEVEVNAGEELRSAFAAAVSKIYGAAADEPADNDR
jgi:hypothetical protein